MQPATRHDDLDELRQRKITVPALFLRGAWLTVPLGAGAGLAPGPRGTQLLLWLPVASAAEAAPGDVAAPSWADVDAAIGARGATTSRTVPAAAAALWDGSPGPELTIGRDQWTVRGAEYPSGAQAFGNIFWKHGWALGTRAGLLVSLVNA